MEYNYINGLFPKLVGMFLNYQYEHMFKKGIT